MTGRGLVAAAIAGATVWLFLGFAYAVTSAVGNAGADILRSVVR